MSMGEYAKLSGMRTFSKRSSQKPSASTLHELSIQKKEHNIRVVNMEEREQSPELASRISARRAAYRLYPQGSTI